MSSPTASSSHSNQPASPNKRSEDDFNSTECLFCLQTSASAEENMKHMLRSHGLFIPDREHLMVDEETLLAYLHLVISVYFQCLHCSKELGSADAARHHMIGKGHCKFDISSPESEFREFYNFDGSQDEEEDEDDDEEGEKELHEVKEGSTDIPAVPIQPDEQSLRLSSGKVITHRSARATRHAGQPKQHSLDTPSSDQDLTSSSTPSLPTTTTIQPSNPSPPTPPHSSALTRAAKKGALLSSQLVQLRAEDRRNLMHLPTSQQRALLASQGKQMAKARRSERGMLARVEGKGNKVLMKHFVPDSPGGRKNG